MKIAVTGDNVNFAYDGSAHSASSYSATEVAYDTTVDITGLFDVTKLVCKQTRAATRTEIGTSNMGLSEADFYYADANVNSIITVTDGSVTVSAKTLDSVTISAVNKTYNGQTQSTIVTVSTGDINLVEGTDYKIVDGSVTSAKDAGTYSITIQGMGNYDSTSTRSVD